MSKKTEHEHYTEAYPKYRVDINNPKNSLGGSDVVTHYAWTEEDDKFILSYSEDGKVKILDNGDGLFISHEVISTLSSFQAKILGLPPTIPYNFKILVGIENFPTKKKS